MIYYLTICNCTKLKRKKYIIPAQVWFYLPTAFFRQDCTIDCIHKPFSFETNKKYTKENLLQRVKRVRETCFPEFAARSLHSAYLCTQNPILISKRVSFIRSSVTFNIVKFGTSFADCCNGCFLQRARKMTATVW